MLFISMYSNFNSILLMPLEFPIASTVYAYTLTALKTKSNLLYIDAMIPKYRKSSKETCGSFSFFDGPNASLIRISSEFGHFCLLFFKFSAGLIRMRVLFEGGSLSRIYVI